MDISSVIGHESILSYLSTIKDNGSVPHSMVFLGPQHVGKRKVADAFVADMVHSYPGTTVRVVDGLDEFGASKAIGIDEIRSVVSSSSYTHSHNAWNIYLLDNADNITDQACNALLKAVEEPTPHTLYVFIVHRKDHFMPTLYSRSALVRFRLVPSKTLRAAAKARKFNITNEDVVRVSGLPGALLDLVEGKKASVTETIFTEPLYKQLGDVSSLSVRDSFDLECSLRMLLQKGSSTTTIKMVSQYIQVRQAVRMGTFASAAERLFFSL